MKRFLAVLIALTMTLSLAACSPAESVEPEVLTGSGEGFKGEIVVEVTKQGDTITDVKVLTNSETPSVAKEALEQIPVAIVETNSSEVDVVAGATYTSKGIIYAVNNALDPKAYPAPEFEVEVPTDPEAVEASDLYRGFGFTATPRKGPGSDNESVQVWSFNIVFADVIFDQDGKILSITVDQTEVASPNYDGDGMPHFSGFPGQGGYNFDENHDEVVDGKTEDTEEWFMEEVSNWKTKRERGESYQMATGTWASQMDAYQEAFIGKTVEEVQEWFAKYTSDRNGRILKPESDNAEDAAKYEALSEEDKAMVVDVVASASMSLQDGHGDIIGAIVEAAENKRPLDIEKVSIKGLGVTTTPRKGPGSDNESVQVWSINQVYTTTLFDNEGKIIDIYIDQLEIASPNYDGDGMPHLSGLPGQGGYNFDENHDEVVDGKTEDTEEWFMEEVSNWKTKRERGESYQMATGTWASQMDA
ncbi:MAG TPA: hypothetical protein DDX29_03200, partial [Clostridiales bacterium]|nr:hypothetical protein [Clostridiales bacterium]